MDSIKIFKGYNKLSNPNNQNQPSTTTTTTTTTTPKSPPHRNPLTTTVALSLILLLTLTLAAALIALIHESTTEQPDSPSESLTAVCSLTPHPHTCFTSISSLTFNSSLTTDPELIFTLSLKASLDQLKNLTSLPKILISKSNDRRSESALRDCESLFGDAVSRLEDSVRAVEVGKGERVLDEGKTGDLMTWISAAMTCQETCLDGLEEVGSTVLGEVRVKVQKSKEYLSNSLAILANMQSLLHKFHLTMH